MDHKKAKPQPKGEIFARWGQNPDASSLSFELRRQITAGMISWTQFPIRGRIQTVSAVFTSLDGN